MLGQPDVWVTRLRQGTVCQLERAVSSPVSRALCHGVYRANETECLYHALAHVRNIVLHRHLRIQTVQALLLKESLFKHDEFTLVMFASEEWLQEHFSRRNAT